MKIVVITNYWENSEGGGLKKYITNLVSELEDRGLNVNVIFRLGIDKKRKKGSNNKIIFLINSFIYLKKIKPTIIQTFGGWYCLLPAVMYKYVYSCKIVGAFHTEPDKKMPLFGRFLMQILINECDVVTFGSKRLVQKMKEIDGFKFKRIEITPAGIRSIIVPENKIKAFIDDFKIKDDAIILLAIGLTALKHKAEGAKLLIQAVKKVQMKYPNILLILTREAQYSNELKEFSKKQGISENILFTGNIEDPNVALSIAQIYIHTPLGEGGVPQALLEAMIMGKPIIATSVGGIPEAIDNGINGILVEPDFKEIADSIELLLDNKELSTNLGNNARNKAEKDFSWGKLANTFIKLYSI